MSKKYLDDLSKALLWTGGLNIGIIGLLNYNILSQVFGAWPEVLRIIYLSIGLAAVYRVAKDKA